MWGWVHSAPVKVDDVENHHMHSEFYMIDEEAAEKINRAKENGKRVICVGTTSCRTVESAADENGRLQACSGWTEIFIYPGYRFKILDALITNFPSSGVYADHACIRSGGKGACTRRL